VKQPYLDRYCEGQAVLNLLLLDHTLIGFGANPMMVFTSSLRDDDLRYYTATHYRSLIRLHYNDIRSSSKPLPSLKKIFLVKISQTFAQFLFKIKRPQALDSNAKPWENESKVVLFYGRIAFLWAHLMEIAWNCGQYTSLGHFCHYTWSIKIQIG